MIPLKVLVMQMHIKGTEHLKKNNIISMILTLDSIMFALPIQILGKQLVCRWRKTWNFDYSHFSSFMD